LAVEIPRRFVGLLVVHTFLPEVGTKGLNLVLQYFSLEFGDGALVGPERIGRCERSVVG
jgi:hypothetical protein